MRSSYFEKMIKYFRNVYDIDNVFNDLTDTRVYPKYKTKQIASDSSDRIPAKNRKLQ